MIKLICLVLLVTNGYSIVSDWEPVTQRNWLESADLAEDQHAVVLFEHNVLDETNVIKGHTYYHVYKRIHILDEAGRDRADIVVPILGKNQFVKDVLARSIQPDGTIVELSEDQIKRDTIFKQKRHVEKQTRFFIPNVQAGSIIEYQYTIAKKGIGVTWQLGRTDPILDGRFHWKFFRGRGAGHGYFDNLDKYTPGYRWQNISPEPVVESLPDESTTLELLFRVTNVKSSRSESYDPPANTSTGLIFMYYGEDQSLNAFWDSWAEDRWQNLDGKRADLGKLGKLKKQLDKQYSDTSKTVRMKEIYYDFQLALAQCEKREPEHPDPLEKAILACDGSRTKLSILFKELLGHLGIESSFVYLFDRTEYLFIPDHREVSHAYSVIQVPTEAEPLYLRPVYSWLPFGSLPWWLEGSRSLEVRKEEAIVGLVPNSAAAQNQLVSQLLLTWDEEWEVSGQLSQRRKGHFMDAFRSTMQPLTETGRWLECERLLSKELPQLNLDPGKWEGLTDLDKPLTVYADLLPAQLSRPTDKTRSISLDAILQSIRFKIRDGNRTKAVLLPFAHTIRESLTLNFPEGWQLESVPTNFGFKNEAGMIQLVLQALQGGRILSIQVQRSLDKSSFRAGDIEELRDLQLAMLNVHAMEITLSRQE